MHFSTEIHYIFYGKGFWVTHSGFTWDIFLKGKKHVYKVNDVFEGLQFLKYLTWHVSFVEIQQRSITSWESDTNFLSLVVLQSFTLLLFSLTSVTTGMWLTFSSFLCLVRKQIFSNTIQSKHLQMRFYLYRGGTLTCCPLQSTGLPGVFRLRYKNVFYSVFYRQFQTGVVGIKDRK